MEYPALDLGLVCLKSEALRSELLVVQNDLRLSSIFLVDIGDLSAGSAIIFDTGLDTMLLAILLYLGLCFS